MRENTYYVKNNNNKAISVKKGYWWPNLVEVLHLLANTEDQTASAQTSYV